MMMNETEKLLAEAIDTMLKQEAKLGLAFHDKDDNQINERGFEYLHEEIIDMFALKVAELAHADGIMQAFNKTHSYKYIDDFRFQLAMNQEMISTGIPQAERAKALEFVVNIVEELREENEHWSERDAGFNPNLEEVNKVCRPKQTSKFAIQDRRLNTRNLDKVKSGEASPSRTPKRPSLPKDGYDAKSNGNFKNQPGRNNEN